MSASKKYLSFLESIKTPENKTVIETSQQAFKMLFEGDLTGGDLRKGITVINKKTGEYATVNQPATNGAWVIDGLNSTTNDANNKPYRLHINDMILDSDEEWDSYFEDEPGYGDDLGEL